MTEDRIVRMIWIHFPPEPSTPALTRTTTRLGCPARAMLLVIIATIVWGKPESNWSTCTTSAGRRFDVRRSESGNNTKTTSPRRQFIIRSHFRAIPILCKWGQPAAQFGRLGLVYSSLTKIHGTRRSNPRHDHAGAFCFGERFQQFYLSVAVDAFDRLHHAPIMPQALASQCHPER
jgi:hypothetical protein